MGKLLSNSQKIHPVPAVPGIGAPFSARLPRKVVHGGKACGTGDKARTGAGKGAFGGRAAPSVRDLVPERCMLLPRQALRAQVTGPFSRAGRRAEGRRSLLRRGFGARRPPAAMLFVTKAVFPLTGEGGVLNNEKNFRYFLQQLSSGM